MRRAPLSAAAVTALVSCSLACRAPARRAPPPAPTGVALPVSPAACIAADPAVNGDTDGDGLTDRCELALAQAFAPVLVVDQRNCLWQPADARLGGGYLFAARPMPGGVRIAYLPAYFRDCGWQGAACRLRPAGCGAHAGDSELVAVDVAPAGPGRWAATGVFLSAHCFGRAGGRCRWYRGRALAALAWADGADRGAPVVWVARGKHAHYPSRRACDTGHWGYDSCDGNAAAARFPVRTARQNLGSRARPAPAECLTSERLPLGLTGAAAGARECLWDAARPFRGWQADGAGAPPTPYATVLARVAGF